MASNKVTSRANDTRLVISQDDPLQQLQAELESLRQDNQKLKKINEVLIKRVDMGMGNHSTAYQSFEDAVLLTDKVKQRTLKLQSALTRVEDANRQLFAARTESEDSRQRLVDAIESISDAFVLFDDQRKMVLANSRFFEFWENVDVNFEVGKTTLKDIRQVAIDTGVYDPNNSITGKIKIKDGMLGQGMFQMKSGRWIRMSERPTVGGGLVMVYTDITAIKESETRFREKALAEKSWILQSTLDNISQGVALVSADGKLEAWNDSFLEVAGLTSEQLETDSVFVELMGNNEIDFPVPETETQAITRLEQTLASGQVLEIKHHSIAGGGYVNTYTDITERSEHEVAIKESEQRIRLITDAMPALISYIRSDMRYDFVNQGFEQWFSRPRKDIVGKLLWEVMGQQEFDNHQPFIAKAMNGEVVNFEMEQTVKDSGRLISHKTYVPHFNSQKQVIGVFALEQDVTKQRETAEALRSAYQTMEQRVLERTQDLRHLNTKLELEIEERTQIEEDLIRATQEAENANIAKTKFMAAISHDLLQPMNAAKLFVSALNESAQPGKVGELVSSLAFSLEDMESLLNALVDISKLDAGIVKAVQEPFQADELLENLANESQSLAKQSNIDFDYIPTSVVIHTDSQLLARILRNLLSNAFRYTDEGRILMGCRRRRYGLEIQIFDTGVGIDDNLLEEVCLEFKRGDNRKRQDRGLGLGLAIVDKISRVLGHDIGIQSQLGKGSMFSVTVPYGEKRLIEQENFTSKIQNTLTVFNGFRVLVVDNDASICEGMQNLLGMWGCDVITALSLQEVQSDKSKLENLDMLIADYHLDDGVTGMQVIDYVNQFIQVPVLMITANYTDELRKGMMQQGYHLMNKPLQPLKLKSLMQHVLLKSRVTEH